MDDSTPLEGQQRLAALGLGIVGQAVSTVLIHGRIRRLGEVGFEFDGRHWDTVDEQHQINRQLA